MICKIFKKCLKPNKKMQFISNLSPKQKETETKVNDPSDKISGGENYKVSEQGKIIHELCDSHKGIKDNMNFLYEKMGKTNICRGLKTL